jgi:hypothetical protein
VPADDADAYLLADDLARQTGVPESGALLRACRGGTSPGLPEVTLRRMPNAAYQTTDEPQRIDESSKFNSGSRKRAPSNEPECETTCLARSEPIWVGKVRLTHGIILEITADDTETS